MKIKEMIEAIDEGIENEELELIHKDDKTYSVYDLNDGKEINYNLVMNKEILKDKIYCNKKFMYKYNLSEEKIADVLISMMPEEAFYPLNKIIFLYQVSDFKKVAKFIYGTYVEALYGDDFDIDAFYSGEIGKLCFWQNCVFVNLRNLEKFARKTSSKDSFFDMKYYLENELWITLFHEMRHLMLNCNPYLDEEEYPAILETEENVERFARDTFEGLIMSDIDFSL